MSLTPNSGPARTLSRVSRRLAVLVTAAALSLTGIATVPSVAHAATIDGLDGTGSSEDPFVIDSAEHLDAAAAAVNDGFEAYGSLHYRLGADIDYRGATFDTFARFSGVFDGNGHAIENLTLKPGSAVDSSDANATQTGFAQILTGTITGLTLRNVVAVTAGGTSARVQQGAFAGRISGATITRSALISAEVKTPANIENSSAVGGLVGKSVGAGNTIADNLISDVEVFSDKRVGGVIGWQNSAADVSNTLIVDTRVTQNGSSGAGAAFIAGHTVFAGALTGNVVISGRITQSAPASYGWVRSGSGGTSSGNLVNADNNIDPAAPVGHTSAPDPNPFDVFWSGSSALDTAGQWTVGDLGQYATREELGAASTYTDLGWDFENGWRWDAEAGHPVPQSAPSITTALTSLTIGLGDVQSEAQILSALGASADRGTPTIDLTDVDFHTEGVYRTAVLVTEGRFTSSVPVEITVTALPFITVAETSVSYRAGSAPTPAEVLDAIGASTDRGVLGIDLSGVDFAVLGSYEAKVTATDGADEANPVTVTINVTPLAGAGTAASPYRIDSVADLDAAAAFVNADAAGSGAAAARYRLTEDLDYGGAAFAGFTRFSGVFDGAGHAVSDLEIVAEGNPGAGFFAELVGAEVTGLTLADVDITNTVGTSRAGIIAASAANSKIERNTILGGSVTLDFATGANNGQAAGVVASTSNGTRISDNLVMNSTVRGAKYAAGISAYPLNNQGNAVVNNLLVDVTVSARAAGAGSTVGLINAQGGTGVDVSGNAVIRGGVGSDTAAAVENIIPVSLESTASTVNRVSAATSITPKGARIPTAAQVAELPAASSEETYAALTWGFDAESGPWAWDDSRAHPVPAASVFPSAPVSIDLAGGVDGGANPAAHGYGATTRLVAPTREHHVFAGWTGTGITGAATEVTLPRYPSEALAYTATWTAIEFTIAYDLAGGTAPDGNPGSYTVDSEPFSLKNPTRTGYAFAGWTGTGITGASDAVTVASGSTGNRAYAATWTPVAYGIDYDLAGGAAEGANPPAFTVETSTFALTNPSRPGYSFAGWTGTGLPEPTRTVTVPVGSTGARSFTATWSPVSYDLIYELADDEDFAEEPRGSYSIESEAFTLPAPVRPGYTFTGWTGTDLTEPTLSVGIPAGSIGDRSYAPTWSPTEYSIRYQLRGGTIAAGNPSRYTVESAPFVLRQPTRLDYTFAGWSGLGVTRTALTVPSGTTGDLAFAANWKKRAKTVSSLSVSYAKKPKTQRNHSAVSVTVRTASGYTPASGSLSAKVTGKVKKKVGKKTRWVRVSKTVRGKLAAGRGTVKIPRGLRTGSYKLTVAYHGNSVYKKGAAKALTLRVKKR
ncbi:InlB B-repeat-containing protein [Leucobacter weissii]|uniref:InlB B-repeat-containing protein n=1 Tax=Leucobacter weissii TaxID=1983706 RepID=A0A939MPK4_9MICO|nr:InlB B-repeat-containing protein [Leucobacter weissii]MBO1900709.1 InlB B-repeat-containing protein [Leucobacter weissii]